MRDPERIPGLLDLLEQAWMIYPDLRLFQLLTIIGNTGKDPFYIEDEEWIKLIEEFITNNKPT